ncbi:MAG: septum formation initiator family protein [Treponema sp.]|nr:septum formation initiator family protein [Treponema sp.]
MRIFKYLLGIWAAIAVYALFSFFAGPKGMSAYNYLLSEKEQQWENIRELGIINEKLEITRNNLLYDQETLLVYARQMGYGHEDERFIRIVGLSSTKPVPAEVGNVYSAQKPDYISDKSIKIAALCIGFLLFAFLFMLEFIESGGFPRSRLP